MKRMMTFVALMCAVAFQVNAQNSVEQALKEAEAKAKLADKNPTNGKMQYQAAVAFLGDKLGEAFDVDRALPYAERALKIAQEHPSPKDTLMGLTCNALATIYLGKKDYEKAFNYYEMAADGFQQELGRHDPVTNGTKLLYSYMMMITQPARAFSKIQEAFFDNDTAPADKRIQNMDEANIILEMALEMLIADYTKRFRYALPQITYEGKKYLLVQTSDWNMERPLVGWMQSSFRDTDEEEDSEEGDDTILCGDNFQMTVIPNSEKKEIKLEFNFKHFFNNPKNLELNDDDARLLSFNKETYNQILTNFREFKARPKVKKIEK